MRRGKCVKNETPQPPANMVAKGRERVKALVQRTRTLTLSTRMTSVGSTANTLRPVGATLLLDNLLGLGDTLRNERDERAGGATNEVCSLTSTTSM